MRWTLSNACHRAWPGLAAALLVALAGCGERDRIGTAPDDGGGGGEGEGPVTTIRLPGVEDTTVAAGPGLFVAGLVEDDDGIDSVYFETTGGVTTFEPFDDNGSREMSFALPITTAGQEGQQITVEVYGVDQLGNRGAPATRRIRVQ